MPLRLVRKVLLSAPGLFHSSRRSQLLTVRGRRFRLVISPVFKLGFMKPHFVNVLYILGLLTVVAADTIPLNSALKSEHSPPSAECLNWSAFILVGSRGWVSLQISPLWARLPSKSFPSNRTHFETQSDRKFGRFLRPHFSGILLVLGPHLALLAQDRPSK